MDISKMLDAPLSDYIVKDFVTVSPSDSVSDASKAMLRAGATEAVAVKDGRPIGIVTERDILYKVVAEGKDPTTTVISTIMSTPVESISAEMKVGDAIARMSELDVRRLLVMKGGKLAGMITQRRIVSGQGKAVLPELISATGLGCPYCGASLKDASELSKHIDQLHIGGGLLSGDATKW